MWLDLLARHWLSLHALLVVLGLIIPVGLSPRRECGVRDDQQVSAVGHIIFYGSKDSRTVKVTL